MASNRILDIQNLSIDFKTYDGLSTVVQNVDLHINKGEIIGLAGESGCGKTVTAKTILGTLPRPPGNISSGSIMFNNEDLLQKTPKELSVLRGKEFALIPQEPTSFLNPVFKVGDQMVDMYLFHGRPDVGLLKYYRDSKSKDDRKEARDRAIEMLHSVNIPDPERVTNSYPFELSGGMKQRVLIAMALMWKPSFLIADEPATALDVSVGDQVNELLETRVREEGISVLYITHDLGVAKRLCDRIYVMYAGNVVETATTEKFFNNPKHPYTHGLLQSVPKIYGEMSRGIEGAVPNYYSPPTGCRFHPRCKQAMPICKKDKPSYTNIDDEHLTACYLYEENKNE